MAEPVKGTFVDVHVKKVRKLDPPKGKCLGFADIVVHGIEIRNLTVFHNEKDNRKFVKPPQQKGGNKYFPIVNFGNLADSINAAVLSEFK
jgi:hypothetical protein